MRVYRTLSLIAGLAALTIGFQNFDKLPLSKLGCTRLRIAQAEAASVNDIRQIAPRRPASLDAPIVAQPQSGNDLNSISQDWLTRQAHLITDGEDQKLLDDVNKKMQRAVRNLTSDDQPEQAPGHSEVQAPPRQPAFISSFRVASLNRIEMGFRDSANLSCTANGSGVQLDLSRSLSQNMNLNLRHDSSTNSSTVQLRYAW